jgi:hypothetical protein
MRCRLTRVQNGAGLRTDQVEGDCQFPPTPGTMFAMLSEPLDQDMDVRLVRTSPVVSLGDNGMFTTETGSHYKFEVLSGAEMN